MKTQITKLEKQVLDGIQEFTDNLFSSDSCGWAYIEELADTIEPRILRGVISSLIKKGVLVYDGTYDIGYVYVTKNYKQETGNYTEGAGSPEFEYINIEVK